MIVGIGTDIVEIARIKKLIEKEQFSDRFAKRVLTATEYEEYQQLLSTTKIEPERFLAKRFAAKESAAKALGTGFRQGLRYQHIGVTHDDLGKPMLVMQNVANDLCERLRVKRPLLTLSDEQHYVVAFTLLESD